MKNKYTILGDVTEIEIINRKGRRFVCLIDTEDLGKVSAYKSWGANVGFKDKTYVYASVDGKSVKIHRVINDCPPDKVVDHINGNPLDNRKSNLRNVTQSENQLNRLSAQSNSKSGIRGVTWHKQRRKWRADIKVRGKQVHLGCFSIKEDAQRAVENFLQDYWEGVTHD